jgi:formiminotetrahydrofolate cyclodeaminase
MAFAELPLRDVLGRVASADPTPGAGPGLAWTCALAAGLVEMVCGVSLRQESVDRSSIEQRRARAEILRANALVLADADADAYEAVLAVQRRRDQPDHGARLREALHAAADPLLSIVEAAGEVTRLAVDAMGQVRGGARGEAKTAAILGAAVVEAGVPLIELNLAGAPDEPRLARARELALCAREDRARAMGES